MRTYAVEFASLCHNFNKVFLSILHILLFFFTHRSFLLYPFYIFFLFSYILLFPAAPTSYPDVDHLCFFFFLPPTLLLCQAHLELLAEYTTTVKSFSFKDQIVLVGTQTKILLFTLIKCTTIEQKVCF